MLLVFYVVLPFFLHLLSLLDKVLYFVFMVFALPLLSSHYPSGCPTHPCIKSCPKCIGHTFCPVKDKFFVVNQKCCASSSIKYSAVFSLPLCYLLVFSFPWNCPSLTHLHSLILFTSTCVSSFFMLSSLMHFVDCTCNFAIKIASDNVGLLFKNNCCCYLIYTLGS